MKITPCEKDDLRDGTDFIFVKKPTHAATGRAEQRGVGWRGALRIALCHDSMAA
jgi:hypothetical protein